MIPSAATASSRRRARMDRFGLFMGVVITAALGVVPLRVAQLQLLPGERLVEYMPDRISAQSLDGRRGDILDRRGRPLAVSREGRRLFVDPTEFEEPYGQSIGMIAGIAGLDETVVGERIVKRIAWNRERRRDGRPLIRYVPIGGVLSRPQLEQARQLDIGGVYLERIPVRDVMAEGSLASLVGKVGPGERAVPTGRAGVEQTFDARLRSKGGKLEYVRDAWGRPMWLEPSGYEPPAPGEAVRLSIDVALQGIAVEELARGIEEANAAGGRLVMVDPLTGEVLAMVDRIRDVPDLVELDDETRDLAALPQGEHPRFRTIEEDPYRDSEPALARNRCVVDVFEPGSTMKPFVWASLTERGLARPDETIETHGGAWRTDFGRLIRDVTPKEELTWREVLVYSSNIGMAKASLRLSGSGLRSNLVRFGFGRRTGLDLPGESPGLVTPESRWTHWTQTSVCSGYEIAVTPVQMARAFCVFARQGDLAGTLPSLTLLARDGERRSAQEVIVRAIPAWVADEARGAMEQVAARMNALVERKHPDEPAMPYEMFGKSGTAEIVRPDGRGYIKGQHNSSFIGAAPADRPRLVVIVVIDDPGPELVERREHYGSHVAGPVARRVLRRSLEHLGVPPSPALADAAP